MGVGCDDDGGHTRVTFIDENHVTLVGGSETIHEEMTEHAIRFNEALSAQGKCLRMLSGQEFIDLMRDTDPTT